METNKIDIAALLKDCPKGTKLYSPICGNMAFEDVVQDQILCHDCTGDGQVFFADGRWQQNGECLLFPSRDNRDWSTFKAPQEEQPKFKVGDVVKANSDLLGNNNLGVVKSTEHVGYKYDRYILFAVDGGKAGNIDMPINDTDRLATPEEIDTWNKETLEPNHLHYSKSKRKIIHWFLPFDKIIERCKDDDMLGIWSAGLFSHYDKEASPCYPYHTVAGMCNECLPYNETTAHLIGTTEDYHED